MVPIESFDGERCTTATGADASCHPYYNASPLSDDVFSRLFNNPSSPEPDLHFFEDGLASDAQPDLVGQSGGSGDGAFSFDSMVDLDAGQPNDSFVTFEHSFDGGLDCHNHHDVLATDFSHQPAATSSGLQPSVGAPS